MTKTVCAITIVMRKTYSNGIFSNGKQSNKNVIKGFEETQKKCSYVFDNKFIQMF